MKLHLHVWRQASSNDTGRMVDYVVNDVSPDTSFLEMLDILNQRLIEEGDDPDRVRQRLPGGDLRHVQLDDQRRRPRPRAPARPRASCTCARSVTASTFTSSRGAPTAFPVIKRPLTVDRSAFDRIMNAGGFVSVRTGGAPDANALPIPKEEADLAMDAAACIGCGACVAACKNASPMLFVGAKVSQYLHLPQGQPERSRRVADMVEAMDKEGFGSCTNTYECEAVCPKEIPVRVIAELNREYVRSSVTGKE